jgi:hypothetical protein
MLWVGASKKLALLCCVVLSAAVGVCAQSLENVAPGQFASFGQSTSYGQSTSFELARNDSVEPIGNVVGPNEFVSSPFVPNPFVPVIKPSLPDVPTPVSNDGYEPLSSEGRWHNFWNDTLLSPLAYVGAFGGAYGQQLSDQPRQWGNSFAGYAKRVGTNLAQFGSQEAIHQGGAALMHTDPRYLNCRCKGGLQRTWYALKMSFLTYKEDGDKTVDIPQLAGAYGGAIISDVPYPRSNADVSYATRYSPLVQGVRGGNIQIGANVAINLFREFSPELSRLNPFRRRGDESAEK